MTWFDKVQKRIGIYIQKMETTHSNKRLSNEMISMWCIITSWSIKKSKFYFCGNPHFLKAYIMSLVLFYL